MENSLHQALSAAVLHLLRPLARVLLNHGLSYGAFAELARKAFVMEGFEYVERSGKRATISSVSALTGMTRKEVKRLHDLSGASDEPASERYNRAIRVISGWVNDAEFNDPRGEPAQLPVDGSHSSFSSLVKKYSGDIPPMAMLSVLESSGNVLSKDGAIELKERAYLPSSTPLDKINILGRDVAELIGTIGHNLETEPGQRFFQRKVSNTTVSAEALPEFRRYSNQRSQELLEDYHAWLCAHQVEPQTSDTDQARYVAVGVYYTELSG